MRLMGKVSGGRLWEPFGLPSATNHPAATATTAEYNDEYLGQFTQVLSNRAVNEVRGGKTEFGYDNRNLTSWSNHWARSRGVTTGSPRIAFTGFLITGNQNFPRRSDLDVWSLRDDFTYSFNAKGRHDVRTGGEYLHRGSLSQNCRQCMGLVDARNGPTPTAAQLQAWFPDAFNVDTWNLAALSPLVRSYTISTGNYVVPHDSQKLAGWVQDDGALLRGRPERRWECVDWQYADRLAALGE